MSTADRFSAPAQRSAGQGKDGALATACAVHTLASMQFHPVQLMPTHLYYAASQCNRSRQAANAAAPAGSSWLPWIVKTGSPTLKLGFSKLTCLRFGRRNRGELGCGSVGVYVERASAAWRQPLPSCMRRSTRSPALRAAHAGPCRAFTGREAGTAAPAARAQPARPPVDKVLGLVGEDAEGDGVVA